jgi:hypothetical protein
MAKLQPYKGNYYLWHYVPSIAAAIIFCILFFIASVAHSWKTYRTRAHFCIVFCIGGICKFRQDLDKMTCNAI